MGLVASCVSDDQVRDLKAPYDIEHTTRTGSRSYTNIQTKLSVTTRRKASVQKNNVKQKRHNALSCFTQDIPSSQASISSKRRPSPPLSPKSIDPTHVLSYVDDEVSPSLNLRARTKRNANGIRVTIHHDLDQPSPADRLLTQSPVLGLDVPDLEAEDVLEQPLATPRAEVPVVEEEEDEEEEEELEESDSPEDGDTSDGALPLRSQPSPIGPEPLDLPPSVHHVHQTIIGALMTPVEEEVSEAADPLKCPAAPQLHFVDPPRLQAPAIVLPAPRFQFSHLQRRATREGQVPVILRALEAMQAPSVDGEGGQEGVPFNELALLRAPRITHQRCPPFIVDQLILPARVGKLPMAPVLLPLMSLPVLPRRLNNACIVRHVSDQPPPFLTALAT